MDAMFNKQSPTGQTMKKKQLKKTIAENNLKQKYDETLRKMHLLDGQQKKSKPSKTKSTTKTTTNVELYEEESSRQNNLAGQPPSLMKNLLSGTTDHAGMLLHQMHLSGVQVNNSDILMSKFGVSSQMPKFDKVTNSQNSVRDAQNKNHLHQQTNGPSHTNQIFLNDIKKQAELLPIETLKNNESSAVKIDDDKQVEEHYQPGFKDYKEQEALDKASINDLIVTLNSNSVIKKVRRPISRSATGQQNTYEVNFTSENSIFSADAAIGRSALASAKSEENFDQKINKNDLSKKVPNIKVWATQRNLQPQQSFVPELTSCNEETIAKDHGDVPNLITVTQLDMSSVIETVETEDLVSQNNLNLRTSSGLALIDKLYADKKLLPDFSVEQQKEKFQQLSSMGSIVQEIFLTEQSKPHEQIRYNSYRGNLADKKHDSDKDVINQRTFMIQHDFNPNLSKLITNNNRTQKAQKRMNQLIRLIRDKASTSDEWQIKEDPDEESDDDPNRAIPAKTAQDNTNKHLVDDSQQQLDMNQTEEQTDTRNIINTVSMKVQMDEIDSQMKQNLAKFKERKDEQEKEKEQAEHSKAAQGEDDVIIEAAQGSEEEVSAKNQNGDFITGSLAFLDEDNRNKRYEDNIDDSRISESLLDGNKRLLNQSSDVGSIFDKMQSNDDSNNTNRYNISVDVGGLKPIKNPPRTNRVHLKSIDFGVRLKKKMINTDFLTIVPKGGRMIGARSYIRDNLLPYADNDHFVFSKKTAVQKSRGDLHLKTYKKSAIANSRNIMAGNMLRTLPQTNFLQPVMQLSYTESRQSPTGTRTSPTSIRTTVAKDGKTLDFGVPIVRKKKKTKRFSKSIDLYNKKYDRSSRATNHHLPSLKLSNIDDTSINIDSQEINITAKPKKILVEIQQSLPELKGDNQALRQQLDDMVLNFEQYLKVAILKNHAEKLKEDQEREASLVPKTDDWGKVPKLDLDDVDQESENAASLMSKSQSGDESEILKERVQEMGQTSQPVIAADSKLEGYESKDNDIAKKNKTRPSSKSNKNKEPISINIEGTNFNSSQKSPKSNKNIVLSEQKLLKEEREINFSLNKLSQREIFFSNHNMPFIRTPAVDRIPVNSQSRRDLLLNASKMSLKHPLNQSPGRNSVTSLVHSNQKDYTNYDPVLTQRKNNIQYPDAPSLFTKNNPFSILNQIEHTAHNKWLKRIQKIWDKLDNHKNYDEVTRIQQSIKENKQKLDMLYMENQKVYQRNFHQTKGMVKTLDPTSNKSKKELLLVAKVAKERLLKMEEKYKQVVDVSLDLNEWGLSSHVIEQTVKCRVLEDLVDCAQRNAIRPDLTVERELFLMKLLSQQTWDDINQFVIEREQYKWRTWENPKDTHFRKQDIIDNYIEGKNTKRQDELQQYKRDHKEVTQGLHLWIEKSIQLESDQRIYVTLCREIVQFCNMLFGNTAWQTLSYVKMMRKANHEKTESIERNLAHQPNPTSNLNWLQLTQGHQDLIIPGPQPFWGIQSSKNNTIIYEAHKVQEVVEPTSLTPQPDDGPVKIDLNTVQEGADTIDRIQDDSEQKTVVDEGASQATGGQTVHPKQDTLLQLAHLASKAVQQQSEKQMQDDSANQQAEQVQEAEDLDKQINKVKSKWQQIIEKENLAKNQRKKLEQDTRSKRLANLFTIEAESSNSDSDEKMNEILDRGAAKTGIDQLMDKVNVHLQVEMNVLTMWNDKDKALAGKEKSSKKIKPVVFQTAEGFKESNKDDDFKMRLVKNKVVKDDQQFLEKL